MKRVSSMKQSNNEKEMKREWKRKSKKRDIRVACVVDIFFLIRTSIEVPLVVNSSEEER